MFLHKLNIYKLPISQFLGFFVLTKAEAYFPLNGYFAFVAFAYWIGRIYQKMSDKDKFYNRILIFFFLVSIYQYSELLK